MCLQKTSGKRRRWLLPSLEGSPCFSASVNGLRQCGDDIACHRRKREGKDCGAAALEASSSCMRLTLPTQPQIKSTFAARPARSQNSAYCANARVARVAHRWPGVLCDEGPPPKPICWAAAIRQEPHSRPVHLTAQRITSFAACFPLLDVAGAKPPKNCTRAVAPPCLGSHVRTNSSHREQT